MFIHFSNWLQKVEALRTDLEQKEEELMARTEKLTAREKVSLHTWAFASGHNHFKLKFSSLIDNITPLQIDRHLTCLVKHNF